MVGWNSHGSFAAGSRAARCAVVHKKRHPAAQGTALREKMVKSPLRWLLFTGISSALLVAAHAQSISSSDKDDGQWTMPAKNYQATRYSELNQINAMNA